MTRKFPKISASQLFCVMLLSRLTMDVISPPSAQNGAPEAIAAIVVTEIVRLILASPLIFFSYRQSNFYRSIYTKSKALGWISAAAAAVLLILSAVKTLTCGADFACGSLLSGANYLLVLAVAAAFAVYAAYMGVEALARAGVLVLVAAGIITAVVFLADIPYMKIATVWFNGSYTDFFGDVLSNLLNGGEYLVFAALLPYTDRKKSSAGNAVLWFALCSAAVSSILCAGNFLVLREMYPLAEYPFIAAASLSDIALFKRLDGLTAAVWSLCAGVRSGLFGLSAVCAVREVVRAGRSCPEAEASS